MPFQVCDSSSKLPTIKPPLETSCIKYVEDEDYDINLDEMFDQAQKVIDCLLDSQETGLQKHHVTLHFLRHHILPQIRISQNDLDLVRKAFRMQEQHIAAIDADLEECNNTRTALKSTLSNLQHKIVPSLVKYSQVRHLYPAVTNSLSERLSAELLQLQGDTLTPKVKERSDEVVQQLESLKKSSKPPSKSWRKRHSGLLEELEDVFVVYEESDRHRKSWRLQEKMLLSAKVKATLIKEQLRGVEDQLSKASETLGYDIPSSHTKDSIRYSHSLYDSVLKLIQDVSHELGMRHLLQCNWIIETCKFTELLWTEQPHRIPSTSELFFPETSTEDGFTIINEAYVFSAISDRITAQCAYAVGQLLKLLPRPFMSNSAFLSLCVGTDWTSLPVVCVTSLPVICVTSLPVICVTSLPVVCMTSLLVVSV
ncbi:hypothetical protein EB796_006823 [Bugula neritina]|uniref:Uncharacterized protein n=1 Tax=Bugula neritina TaxID=10212 RepID=A0A7J7K9F9_BUGNE|nr:hypothetical protein EB796_006823 [Bugula neritina]